MFAKWILAGTLENWCKGQLKECILWKGRHVWSIFQKIASFSSLLLLIGGKSCGPGILCVECTGQLGKLECPKVFVCTPFTLHFSLVDNSCTLQLRFLISPYRHFVCYNLKAPLTLFAFSSWLTLRYPWFCNINISDGNSLLSCDRTLIEGGLKVVWGQRDRSVTDSIWTIWKTYKLKNISI